MMNDAEREAELRCDPISGMPRGGDVAFVLRLLDEARDQADQRTCEAYRQARADLRADGFCMACGVYHRVGGCAALENARREARAAAIEEAAQAVEKYSLGTGHVVRALADADLVHVRE